MNNKILNILSILILFVIVGIMSWRDMHPKIEADTAPAALGLLTYYVGGPDITPAMIPDDSKPVTIGLGDFDYTPDDKVIWMPSGIPPATFAQRQVNLQFNFKRLPHDPAQTIKTMQTVLDGWTHKGDTINVLILDYSPEKADLKAYAVLLKAAYGTFSKPASARFNFYTLYAGINTLWAEGPQKDILKDIQDYAPQFLIHVPQVHIAPELLSRLEGLKYNIVLQFPAGARVEDLDMGVLKKITSLTGVTLTLDSRNPLPKKEEKVGLFPKF